MYDGTLEYRGHLAGLEFGPFEVQGDHPSVPKIVLASSQDGNLTVTVHVTKVKSLEDAKALGDPIATRMADTLAFDRGRSVTGPSFASHSFMREVVGPDGTRHKEAVVSQTIFMTMTADATVKVGPNTETEMQAALEAKSPPGARYYGMFRSALNNGDAVSKFMAVYNILLLLNNDRQADVDASVKQEEPTVVETPSPFKQGVMETVYTRLRNEFGHRRRGATFEGTRAEMEANLDKLVEVVRALIRRQPCEDAEAQGTDA